MCTQRNKMFSPVQVTGWSQGYCEPVLLLWEDQFIHTYHGLKSGRVNLNQPGLGSPTNKMSHALRLGFGCFVYYR